MFFDSWSGLGRVALVGVLAYVTLVVVLRLSGKRTLSKMNAFDLVVTVALGSTLATIVLTSDVALAEGVLALVLLVAAQYGVAWLAVRSRALRTTIRSGPALLLWAGRPLDGAMREQRISLAEVRQAVRSQGIGGLDQVKAVVMEPDGSLSVIPHGKEGDLGALGDVLDPAGNSDTEPGDYL